MATFEQLNVANQTLPALTNLKRDLLHAARFADRFGFAPDVRSGLYADAWLRHQPTRRPSVMPIAPPAQRYIYRKPSISDPGLYVPLSVAVAIADTPLSGQDNSGAGSTLTFNYANTSGDCMNIFGTTNNGKLLNTPTWNGSSTGINLVATLLTSSPNGYRLYWWILKSPTTGTHSIVLTETGGSTTSIWGAVLCFSGSDTTTQPDNSSNTGTSSSSPMDATGSTTTDGAWPLCFAGQNGAFISAGTGATRQVYTAPTGEVGEFDNNVVLASHGSFTIEMGNVSAASGWISAAIRPSGGAPPPSNWGPSLLSHSWNRLVQ